jgi:hypothetical protein
VRTNFNFTPTPKLTIDAGIRCCAARRTFRTTTTTSTGSSAGRCSARRRTRQDTTGGKLPGGWFGGATRNVAAISAIQNAVETRRSIISGSASYVQTDWLRHRFTVGGDLLTDDNTRFFPKNAVTAYGGLLDGGQNGQGRIGQQRYTVDYVATSAGGSADRDQPVARLAGHRHAVRLARPRRA